MKYEDLRTGRKVADCNNIKDGQLINVICDRTMSDRQKQIARLALKFRLESYWIETENRARAREACARVNLIYWINK